ncbi:MAG: hypothetical protein VKL39_24510 [Leptolyngbyaceae bacterium]|nr:hypothetical protein [Leptolyngbyaceae bacterium]
METKWTPGDWRVEMEGKRANVVLLERTDDGAVWEYYIAEDQRPADAHLIAAAPVLYSTLEWLRDNPQADLMVRHAIIETALAKARGEHD